MKKALLTLATCSLVLTSAFTSYAKCDTYYSVLSSLKNGYYDEYGLKSVDEIFTCSVVDMDNRTGEGIDYNWVYKSYDARTEYYTKYLNGTTPYGTVREAMLAENDCDKVAIPVTIVNNSNLTIMSCTEVLDDAKLFDIGPNNFAIHTFRDGFERTISSYETIHILPGKKSSDTPCHIHPPLLLPKKGFGRLAFNISTNKGQIYWTGVPAESVLDFPTNNIVLTLNGKGTKCTLTVNSIPIGTGMTE